MNEAFEAESERSDGEEMHGSVDGTYLVDPAELIRRRQAELASRESKRARGLAPLYTVAMSSHVRGLECWHALIRTGVLPFKCDCLVHVDSHPDMMLPKASLEAKGPKEIYETLEASLGGIAEWLLPAVFLGHCQRVVWIRAQWCDQIRDGIHEFYVGKDKMAQTLHVTCTEPYFIDEPDMHRNIEDLEDAVKMTLLVCDATQKEKIEEFMMRSKTWLLDVCLDYFAVSNPFFDHAIKLFGDETAINLRDGFLCARFRDSFEQERTLKTGGARPLLEEEEKADFESAVRLLCNDERVEIEDNMVRRHFENRSDVGEKLVNALKIVRSLGDKGVPVVLELLESPGLPHHPAISHANQEALFGFFRHVSERPPQACMIARSEEDEYTPTVECSRLEARLVEAMNEAWPQIKVEPIEMEIEE